jgi:hypothetical protein
MPEAKAASPRKGAGRSSSKHKFPPVTVAKLEETGRLLERVISENQDVFIRKGQEYKDAHREGSRRPLTAPESGQVAAVIARETNPVEVAEELQNGDLYAYDEPDRREVLLAAGAGTAPEFMVAVRQVVALIEVPNAEFKAAYEADEVDDGGKLRELIGTYAKPLRELELADARTRASAAFDHYAQAAGFESGEALGLPIRAVWQALQGAMSSLVDGSQSSQLIDSAASTAGSPGTTSSSD